MDRTLIIAAAVAVGAAWILGRTDRPAYRRRVRQQEYAVARADLDRLHAEADDAHHEAATARATAKAYAGELAHANAALGRAQALADRLRVTVPEVAEALDAVLNDCASVEQPDAGRGVAA